MTDVRIMEDKVKPQKDIEDFKNGFSHPKHMAEHIYMFSGDSISVKLLSVRYGIGVDVNAED